MPSKSITNVYLDYNATTPVDPRVVQRMLPFFSENFGNTTSSHYAQGWNAAEAVEDARDDVAGLINAKPNEVIFTGSATESINLALKGLAFATKDSNAAIITSSIEHEAVLGTVQQLKEQTQRLVLSLTVDSDGRIDLDKLRDCLAQHPALVVAVMYANNEIGTILPIRQITDIAHQFRALVFVDATQAVGKIPIDVKQDGIDLMAFSAHKIYGPKGVGALFIRGSSSAIKVEPLITGGRQEGGIRSGTLNVPGIVGFGEACGIAQHEGTQDAARISRLRNRLEETLTAKLSDVRINASEADRLPNTSNIVFSNVDAKMLIRDMGCIAVATRSACSSASPGPSHVLKAIGLSDEDAYSSIRFSLGRFTTEEEIDFALEKIISSVSKLRHL